MCWQLWGWSKVKGPWLPRVARMERTAVISLLSLPFCSQRGVLTSSFAVQHVSQQNTSAASLPMAPSWPELCSSWGPSKTLPFELVVTSQISITSSYSVLLASVGKGGNRTREAGRTHRESRLELGWGSILCCRSWGASCWAQKQRLLTEGLRMRFNPAADSPSKGQSPTGVAIVSFVTMSKGSSLRVTMISVRSTDLLRYCSGQHLLAIDLQMKLPWLSEWQLLHNRSLTFQCCRLCLETCLSSPGWLWTLYRSGAGLRLLILLPPPP